MTNCFRRLAFTAAVCFLPTVFADTVNITLTSAGNNILGGVYVNPYKATVNGVVNTTVICDDFSSDTFIGESWTANVSTFDDLTNAKFYNANDAAASVARYNQGAWLTLQLLAATTDKDRRYISYAIWGTFDGSALTYLQSKAPSYVAPTLDWINLSKTQTYSAGQFSNFVVYTPNMNFPITGPKNGPPQEFLAIRASESSAVLLLTFNLFAVAAVAVFFRRRLVQS